MLVHWSAGRASCAWPGKECSKYMNKAIASLRAMGSDASPESGVAQLKSEVAEADKFEQSMSRAERCVRTRQ